jgi:hypothetical protein
MDVRLEKGTFTRIDENARLKRKGIVSGRPPDATAAPGADAFGSPVAHGIAPRAAALVARPPDRDGLAASVAILREGRGWNWRARMAAEGLTSREIAGATVLA